jgi:hypothetical protein
MFFYLIYNSTVIKKDIDIKTKFIKIFLYGGITYIILHATLFIGGKDALLYSLKNYFWLFFILDCMTILFTIQSQYNMNFKELIELCNKKLTGLNNTNTNTKQSIMLNKKKINKFIPKSKIKKVHFNDNVSTKSYDPNNNITNSEESESDYSDSDSDSEIGTDIDIDIEGFKKTLLN